MVVAVPRYLTCLIHNNCLSATLAFVATISNSYARAVLRRRRWLCLRMVLVFSVDLVAVNSIYWRFNITTY